MMQDENTAPEDTPPERPSAHEPILKLPPVTRALVLLNIIVFLGEILLPAATANHLITQFAFIPARYTAAHLTAAVLYTPVTYMFLHAGWLHIGVNVTALMAFGAGVEKVMGGKRMLVFYFITGILGAFTHLLVFPHATIPMIGASGAISGLFGGILMIMLGAGFFGKQTGSGFARYKILLPIILLWIGAAAFFGFVGMPGVHGPIAWTTHIGGFIAGLLLFKPCLRLNI